MSEELLPRRDLFPLTTFLATAARGGLEEGVLTATYRLVDTIRRLLELFPESLEDPFFREIDELLKKNLNKAMRMVRTLKVERPPIEELVLEFPFGFQTQANLELQFPIIGR